MSAPTAVLTFDVEDWFQVENLRPLYPPAAWDAMPRRVAGATRTVLDLLAARGLPATFFVLGWVAEREPALVREIAAAGHEVACHGHGHVLPTRLTPIEFRDDVLRARKVLEDLVGAPVAGYRAPSFSLTDAQLGILAECGFRYDSSWHPAGLHDRYGRLGSLRPTARPGVHVSPAGLLELALPVERVAGVPVPVSGGGWLRLYPGRLFRRLARRALRRDGLYVLYLHSWELDPGQPRVRRIGPVAAFRHYNQLGRVEDRLRRLVATLAAEGARFATARTVVEEAA